MSLGFKLTANCFCYIIYQYMADPKKYELAYLISPAVAENEVLSVAGSLAQNIEEGGGLVRHQETPAKRRLAYLVKKQQNAYFGWITFSASPEKVSMVEKNIKGVANILRHMIVEEQEIPPQPIRLYTPRPAPADTKSRTAPTEAENPEEKLDLEELDKKLEEILGK